MKSSNSGWFYHPMEIAFCGFSGSGKTTLIQKLTLALQKKGHKVGFLKHDAHFFEMDHQGKDTMTVKKSGASTVVIQDKTHSAIITDHHISTDSPDGRLDQVLAENVFLLDDILLIEGNKTSPLPKWILLDPRGEMLEPLHQNQFENILGIIGTAEQAPLVKKYCEDRRLPFYSRDAVEDILSALFAHWESKTPPLYGLVLVGGKSSRMGSDKAALVYSQGQSEACRTALLLQKTCEKVFISVRSGQQLPPDLVAMKIPLLTDQFLDMGPTGGILTAMTQFPTAGWMVVSCDLPLLRDSDVAELVTKRNPFALATCFGSDWEGRFLPEPLCAIYEPKARSRLLGFLGRGVNCPRWVLRSGGANILPPPNPQALFNANHPEDRAKMLAQLAQKKTIGKTP